MCTMWHVDKYRITFKLVISSRRISRGPAVEKHYCKVYERPTLVSVWLVHRASPSQVTPTAAQDAYVEVMVKTQSACNSTVEDNRHGNVHFHILNATGYYLPLQ